jgi:hypothetical protein
MSSCYRCSQCKIKVLEGSFCNKCNGILIFCSNTPIPHYAGIWSPFPVQGYQPLESIYGAECGGQFGGPFNTGQHINNLPYHVLNYRTHVI